MSADFDSRWTVASAKFGVIVWATIAGIVASRKAPLGTIELLFLLAPLVVVPLGFEVVHRHAADAQPQKLGRIVRILQPFAAGLAVVSFWFPTGALAGLFSSPWFVVCVLTALVAIFNLFRPGGRALNRFLFNVAGFDLAIAGCWLMVSRLGITPMHFSEPIVLLTAVHFHYSGFATALLAGVALKSYRRHQNRSGFARWVVAAAVVLPFLLAAGFVFSSALKLVAALLLAITLVGFSLLQIMAAGELRSTVARVLLRIGAALLIPGMLLVIVYSVGEYTGQYWLMIPQMAHTHGLLNGPGFVLLSLLGWVIEKGSRMKEASHLGAEIFSGTAYFSDEGRWAS